VIDCNHLAEEDLQDHGELLGRLVAVAAKVQPHLKGGGQE
jgi:hypothetical protein